MSEIDKVKAEIERLLDSIVRRVREWGMEDYCYLCCNCGFITPYELWTFWKWEDEGDEQKMVPAGKGDMDPICRCPVCKWDHTDDDSNPGIIDGTYDDCVKERPRQAEMFEDLWDDTLEEILS